MHGNGLRVFCENKEHEQRSIVFKVHMLSYLGFDIFVKFSTF